MMMRRAVVVALMGMAVLSAGCRRQRKTSLELQFDAAAEKQRADDLEGALHALDQAVHMAPDSGHALVRRGMVRGKLGDTRGAMEDFERALALDPNNAAAHLGRAVLKRQEKDYAGALSDFDRVLALSSDTPVIWVERGETRALSGDLRGGVEDFTQAIKLDPTCYRAFLRRAYANRALRETDRAIADLRYVYRHTKDPLLKQRAADLLEETRGRPGPGF